MQELAKTMLDVIEHKIIPLTRDGVTKGNKIFGAAILRKDDQSIVIAETNNELENPLWHGEMHALKRFYELPADQRPKPEDCLFVTTHEPCSLCLSAITWTGFDNFYYFFSHEDSRDAFAIPHDLKILKEVFTLDPGAYNRTNGFWKSYSLRELATDADSVAQITRIRGIYDELSETYQSSKDENDIPLN
ncbi:MAG: nucleoside deaminase [Alphaproteobacteria bacterium]